MSYPEVLLNNLFFSCVSMLYILIFFLWVGIWAFMCQLCAEIMYKNWVVLKSLTDLYLEVFLNRLFLSLDQPHLLQEPPVLYPGTNQ